MDQGKSDNNFLAERFNVILTGQLHSDLDREEVIRRLARLFKTDRARVVDVLNRTPVVIQRKLSREKADKYQALVQAAGALCTVKTETEAMILPINDEAAPAISQTLYQPPETSPRPQELQPPVEETNAQIMDKSAWQSLAMGAGITLVVLIIPFLSFIFHYMITLVHELGHAIFGWLFGYPSIPAFDFVYGGGITIHQQKSGLIVLLVYVCLAGLFLFFRRNHLTLIILIVVTAGYTLAVFSSFHYLVILFMGHGTELIFCGIFLYRALSGSSIIVAAERPLYAFLAFFILFKDIRFAYQLFSSPGHRHVYAAAKGGGHWMDFSRIAREFLGVPLESVAGMFFMICLLVIPATYFFFRYRKKLFNFFTRILILEP